MWSYYDTEGERHPSGALYARHRGVRGPEAYTIDTSIDADEAETEGRLIAAAPDMYEALIEARESLPKETIAWALVDSALKKAGEK